MSTPVILSQKTSSGPAAPHGSSAVVPPIQHVEVALVADRAHSVPFPRDEHAALYQVEPRALVQAVKRNLGRFPADFMFQLSEPEFRNLKSQIVISSWGGARRARPYAFTEQGVAMLSSVLRSKRAIMVNIAIMRTFVRLREILTTHKDLARKLAALERKYDAEFKAVFDAIRELMAPSPPPPRRQIGFKTLEDDQ